MFPGALQLALSLRSIQKSHTQEFRRLKVGKLRRYLFWAYNDAAANPLFMSLHKIARYVRGKRSKRYINWNVWDFPDRFRKAVTHLSRHNIIKVEGKVSKYGPLSSAVIIFEEDILLDTILSQTDRLQAIIEL